jgi:hypothetical protein
VEVIFTDDSGSKSSYTIGKSPRCASNCTVVTIFAFVIALGVERAMSEDDGFKAIGQVIQIDEARIREGCTSR